MELSIDQEWTSFEDYVESLSKKYRQRALKIIKSGENLQRRKLSQKDLVELGPRIDFLYNSVVSRQLIKIGNLNQTYFQKMEQGMDGDFSVFGYFLENELIAFSSHLAHQNDGLEVHYIGFDFELNEEYFLYFNILFDGIKAVISQKIKTLKFGRTGYDAKSSAGAVPVFVKHFFKVKRGIPALALKYLLKVFSDKEEAKLKVRNPFKARPVGQEV